MSREQRFRLFSVTVLGALAIAFSIQESENSVLPISLVPAPTEFVQVSTITTTAASASTANVENVSPELELDALREVDEINSGHFKPYEVGAAHGGLEN